MMLTRGVNIFKLARYSSNGAAANFIRIRMATSPSGSILPEPKKPRFGIMGVVFVVCTGIMIGATISKNIANFLEENELFIPSDDDDD